MADPKSKDLVGMPWRVAFGLQADGWYLRSDIIWAKSNPMPESVTDRPTKSHEHVFLLAKNQRYHYDADAVREPAEYGRRANTGEYRSVAQDGRRRTTGTTGGSGDDPSAGRNLRDVWTIATHPYSKAHFATFPPKLVAPCIKAGTSEKGCCAKCGMPWRDKEPEGDWDAETLEARRRLLARVGGCNCGAPLVPCTVLDPFGGAGTVGLVADQLQRDAILIELNEEYATMARARIYSDCPLFADVGLE